ncbi:nuclear transport factor 2 family protein [Rhodococcus sp. 14-2470-1a]|uniref:nuclear transport factor 2 family protein n=1 Tax=Rhodococcus sp. 14-2470-1a TaxID=2023150 RepID=UPI000B9B4D71|nr:nuclear transport factor 2 family protein [Rhodococcus sp. 14-2470-1a]OZF45769.1 hypothetical protein CH292_21205 [Rhodococcus sp. 14-2470-1a]
MSESTNVAVAAGVRAAIGAHTQAQDAGRTEEIVDLYTVDGVLDVPGFGAITGRDALREAFKGWVPAAPQRHLVANTLITATSDDEATATSDVAFFQRSDTGWAVQVLGKYEDTLRLHDGRWLFVKRATTYQA